MTDFKRLSSRTTVLTAIVIVAVGVYYWWHQNQTNKPKQLKKVAFATVPSMVEVTSSYRLLQQIL